MTVADPQDGEQWTRFRGPDGSGVTALNGLPIEWSCEDNLLWKRALPGGGVSSPAVFGDRIFVACYSGFDRWERSHDFSKLALHLVCLDAADGATLWQRDLDSHGQRRRGGYGGARHHGYASATPAVDAEAVYAFFGSDGVYACSHEGDPLWRASVGTGVDAWGTAASPVVVGDRVILNAAAESGALVALGRRTGDELWRRKDIGRTWATPITVEVAGRTELVLNVQGAIRAYDPADGSPLWHCATTEDYVSSSPVAHDGIVYISVANTHGGSGSLAVPAGGSGDVSERVLWRSEHGAQVSSPVYHGGRLYWSSINPRVRPGLRCFYCVDAATGDVLYIAKPERMPEVIYSSPLVADGRIYYASQQAGTYVVAAGDEFEVIAHNVLKSDPQTSYFNASPVPLKGGRLLLRSDWGVYCIRESAP
jgi:outer membrane protein assembly factor BamB